MKRDTVQRKLRNVRKGWIISVELEKPIKLKDGRRVIKRSALQMQVGLPYISRKKVREDVEAGRREAPKLPRWVDRLEKNRTPALRLYKSDKHGRSYLTGLAIGKRPPPRFYDEDGWELTSASVEDDLYAKDKSKPADFYCVALDNITKLSCRAA